MKSTARDPHIENSNALLARATGLIPARTQTLAKGPTQFIDTIAPKYLRSGHGCRVQDVDGNAYLDLSMALGTVSLGYAYPVVDQAIRAQLAEGINFSLMHPLEVEVAELVRAVVPGAEMVRFSKTGADVTSAAVRLARAYTGRTNVLTCGYHGWHDWYVSVTDRNLGVPESVSDLTYTFDYGDLDQLERQIDEDTACVIMEPVAFQLPPPGYLQEVKRLCHERGALLVFDEMWTGFRLALGGAQERFDVTADLATFSKAVANGMPLSILTGRRDVMRLLENDVFFFTTFGGEALSLAAAKATIQEMRTHQVQKHVAARGQRLMEGFARLVDALDVGFVSCVGPTCRSQVVFDPSRGDPRELKTFVQQEMLRRGVLWTGFHNLSFSHGPDDIEFVLDAYREVLPLLKDALGRGTLRAEIRGELIAPGLKRIPHVDGYLGR